MCNVNVSVLAIFYKYYLKTNNYIAELNRKLEGIRDGKMISYKHKSTFICKLIRIAQSTRLKLLIQNSYQQL